MYKSGDIFFIGSNYGNASLHPRLSAIIIKHIAASPIFAMKDSVECNFVSGSNSDFCYFIASICNKRVHNNLIFRHVSH